MALHLPAVPDGFWSDGPVLHTDYQISGKVVRFLARDDDNVRVRVTHEDGTSREKSYYARGGIAMVNWYGALTGDIALGAFDAPDTAPPYRRG